MADTPDLLGELQQADMLIIDDLHAWQFTLGDPAKVEQPLLRVECMDGRTHRVWSFSAAEIAAASYSVESGSWAIAGSTGNHVLTCLGATVGSNDEDDED